MTYQELTARIREKRSFLCIGLDTDLDKIPAFLHKERNAIFEFNRRIVDATAHLAVAYKPNLAFYEAAGEAGWKALRETVQYIHDLYPEIFLIADAKRGDIGNTANQYARAFFKSMPFDAVTLSPYMGGDAIRPFLEYPEKWAIILALTSNPSATELQTAGDPPLYKKVLKQAANWGSKENLMFVAGATQASALQEIRTEAPEHFLLVPGIGAQGGSLQEVARNSLNKAGGLLVNSSRGIIYAGDDGDFDEKAKASAEVVQQEMAQLLDESALFR